MDEEEKREYIQLCITEVKYKKLKEAITKIKEEIELVTRFGNSYQPIEHGLLFSIIDKHTEGLI